ncbi:MAG: 50S ribosomal protein L15 [Phycisphaerae bacterium]|nr:50S ribosomal protein L15 [Phycisphaerae bacterium]
MMNHEITSLVGKHKARRRIGRGQGSGLGKTSGKGHKGQKSRAGGMPPITSEGGQMPLFRRLPKRGFNNVNFATRYAIVNVSQLDCFDEGTRVDAEVLSNIGLVRGTDLPLKVLGDGELNRKLTVVANKFSKSALQKITSAGGTIEQL